MKLFILRCSALGLLFAGGAFAQGTFGQIAFGGCWQTTFTLINMNPASPANVTIFFFGDDGSPLIAPVQGAGNVASYAFSIPISGSQDVVLSSTNPNYTEGWANMTTGAGVSVRGQGTFVCHINGRPDYEAVVPLATSGSSQCIIPLPPTSNPVILLPFDNTAPHTTSLAIANTTAGALSVPIEFDDQTGLSLQTDTLTFTAMQHMAFDTTVKYASTLIGKKGLLRVQAGTSSISIMGLLFNSSGPFTTIIPVTQ